MFTINRSIVEKLMDSCYPTGMECKKCGGKYVSFIEIEDNDEKLTGLHLQCSKCMRTFMELDIVDSSERQLKTEPIKNKTCRCG